MMEGLVKKTVTVTHTLEDEGKVFTDDFGRKYIYTSGGLIYDTIICKNQ